MNHHEMTAQEAADWCAKDDGWTLEHLSTDCPVTAWWRWNDHPTLKSRTWSKSHPYPLTLDSAAAALPEGWVWDRYRVEWSAFKKVNGLLRIVRTPDTGDEIGDRFRLAVLCRIAALIPTEGDRRKMLMAALEELGPRPVKEASDGNQVR